MIPMIAKLKKKLFLFVCFSITIIIFSELVHTTSKERIIILFCLSMSPSVNYSLASFSPSHSVINRKQYKNHLYNQPTQYRKCNPSKVCPNYQKVGVSSCSGFQLFQTHSVTFQAWKHEKCFCYIAIQPPLLAPRAYISCWSCTKVMMRKPQIVTYTVDKEEQM